MTHGYRLVQARGRGGHFREAVAGPHVTARLRSQVFDAGHAGFDGPTAGRCLRTGAAADVAVGSLLARASHTARGAQGTTQAAGERQCANAWRSEHATALQRRRAAPSPTCLRRPWARKTARLCPAVLRSRRAMRPARAPSRAPACPSWRTLRPERLPNTTSGPPSPAVSLSGANDDPVEHRDAGAAQARAQKRTVFRARGCGAQISSRLGLPGI